MREAAINMTRRGFAVTPCRPNTKIPMLPGWQNKGFDTLDVLESWPDDQCNTGVLCGNGIIVIDVDNRPDLGVDGFATLGQLPPLPPTLTVSTANCGEHRYFRVPAGLSFANSAGKLGSGIDVKTDGGQVLAPGSEIDGRAYVVKSEAPIAELPAAWVAMLGRAPDRASEAPASQIGELDTPIAIEQARKAVAGWPDSFEGTRDNDGARLANRLADFGISQGTCLQLLLEWNDTKVHPPLDEADIERLSGVPWRSRQSPVGRDNPLLGLEPVPAPPPAPSRLVFPSDVSLDAIRERKEGALVEDLCHRGELAVIYGDSTAGKSFVALDLAYSIARGEPWHGRKVKQGPVLYVCLEGAGGFKLRMAACEVAKGKAGRNLAMLPGGLVLSRGNLGEAGLSEIFAAVAALQEGAGQPVAAVVIDTLQRAMAGDDENSTSDMAAMVGRIGKIQSETGAAVFLCHHTNAAGNMRGSTALFASADAVLKVSKASGKKRRVYVDKAKDFEDGFDLFWFDLASVEIGEDSAGAKYTAAVVCRVDAGKAQEAAKLMKPEKQHIRIFREAASVCASRKGAVDNGMARVTASDMQAEFFKRYPTGDTDNKMKRDSLLRYWRLTKRDLPAPYELVKDGEADVFQWPCPDF